jgi:SAM-dependent methyltransferase
MTQIWSPDDYATHAGFVPQLGASIFERLHPQSGERILDLGCGDGVLTERIAAAGAAVIGVDSSPEMIAAARARGLDARVMDATSLTFLDEFDAVFSNAVLHWVQDHDAVLAGVARALKPGGRFVAELGGQGNIAAISVAIRAIFARHGITYTWPWNYPTAAEFAGRCAAQQLEVQRVELFPRPTPLPTGMNGWLRTFAVSLFAAVPAEQRADLESEVVDLLAPALRDAAGNWSVDYVRLQVLASKLHSGAAVNSKPNGG